MRKLLIKLTVIAVGVAMIIPSLALPTFADDSSKIVYTYEDAEILPAEVTVTLPPEEEASVGLRQPLTTPESPISVEGSTYEFLGWFDADGNPATDLLASPGAIYRFYGRWQKSLTLPIAQLKVTYSYGETPGLPDAVMETLPEPDFVAVTGDEVEYTVKQPSSTSVSTGDRSYRFIGWTLDGQRITGSSITLTNKSVTLKGEWTSLGIVQPPKYQVTYQYDKEYPEEVMATLPTDNNSYYEVEEVEATNPSPRFLKAGNSFCHFNGWDKERATVDDNTFTGSWTEYKIPENEFSMELHVKFVDEEGTPIESGFFTDSMKTGNKPYYVADRSSYWYDKDADEFKEARIGSTTPDINQEAPNRYETKKGYSLKHSFSVDIREDGYSTNEFTNASGSYTFAELETPEGYKSLEGSVKAYFDIENETIEIESDETGRAYVDRKTLYIVYQKKSALDTAKEEALAELDSIDTSVYSEPEKSEAESAIQSAKDAIESATTEDEVNSALNTAKEVIGNLKTDEEKQNASGDNGNSGSSNTSSNQNGASSGTKKKSTSITINKGTVTAAAVNSAIKKKGLKKSEVKTIILGKKVKKIKAGSFKQCKKAKTLVIKTKRLKKSSVKGSLKGSKISKIKVKTAGQRKACKARYKKAFTKANAGRKAKVS